MAYFVEDMTDFGLRANRIKTRAADTVYALVLHQTGFSRGNNPEKYRKVKAHYVIMPDGRILQHHPVEAYLYASNGFNRRSVAVEFVGNLPNTNGNRYKPEKFGADDLTQAQIGAGQHLVKHLIDRIGLTHVLAHRQATAQRQNCPGPDIWYTVGQWGVREHGLGDGGPGFTIDSGKPIPDLWRNWGVWG